MNRINRVIWFPIWFAIGFIIFNFLFVALFQQALTPQAEEVFHADPVQLLFASSLFLFPNLILSFLLWAYSRNRSSKKELYTLCFTAVAGGFLPQIFIYMAYYSWWAEGGSDISVVMYGFPFVYLFGMMIGWVFGLWIVSYNRAGE